MAVGVAVSTGVTIAVGVAVSQADGIIASVPRRVLDYLSLSIGLACCMRLSLACGTTLPREYPVDVGVWKGDYLR